MRQWGPHGTPLQGLPSGAYTPVLTKEVCEPKLSVKVLSTKGGKRKCLHTTVSWV